MTMVSVGPKTPSVPTIGLNKLLGVGDEYVAGAANLVYFGYGLGAVGHGGDGGDAADLVDGVDAGNLCGGHDGGIEGLARLAGSGKDDFTDAGDAGGDGGHKHGGGIGGCPARGVQANAVKRTDELAEALALIHEVTGHDSLVEILDAPGSELQRFAHVWGELGSGGGDLGGVDQSGLEVNAVKGFYVASNGGIALSADVLEHGGDGLGGRHAGAEDLLGARQDGVGKGGEVEGVGTVEDLSDILTAFDLLELHDG